MQDPLSRIDLNLLVSLQVLMQEKNVTRAAERLFITQPAMSKTLTRLRNLLDDELFVRSSHGLTPTPKTLELEQPVNKILAELTELMVTNQEFDPANSSATISIATLGTSAPRRRAQVATMRPDIVLDDLRGNVPTRVDAVRRGDLSAVLLAAAGLDRLDLDLSGLVNAPYAKPDPSLRIPRVTTRLYRGYCVDRPHLQAALDRTRSSREAIVDELRQIPIADDGQVDKMVKYLDSFFRKAEKDEKMLAKFEKRCL